MIPIPLMPKFSSQIKGTIQIISATQLHKAVVPPSFHRVRTGMTQNPLMASYTLCATRSKDASTNSNAHEGWQRDTTKQPQAILASFISYQQDYGSRVCQHDLAKSLLARATTSARNAVAAPVASFRSPTDATDTASSKPIKCQRLYNDI